MRFGCVLFSPTLEWVLSFSWSAASAPTNGTVKSLRKGGTRQPVTSPMSLGYSTACGSPWEPSCSKDVTFLQGESALLNPFAQCHIYRKIQILGNQGWEFFPDFIVFGFSTMLYCQLSVACCGVYGQVLCLDQFYLLSGWCALSRWTGIIMTLMFWSRKVQRKDGGQYGTTNICWEPTTYSKQGFESSTCLISLNLCRSIRWDSISFYKWGTTEMLNIFPRLHS